MKIWQWLLLLGIIYMSFLLGCTWGKATVICITEDYPTTNNGWKDLVQEVRYEDSTGLSYRNKQAWHQVVRLPSNTNGLGTTWREPQPW